MLKKIEIMIMITISYNDLQIRLISQNIKKRYSCSNKSNNEIFMTLNFYLNGLYTGSRSTFEFPSWVTFPVPVCTVPSSMDRTSCRCNKVDAVRLYASYRLNLLLSKGQICVCKHTLK